MPDPLATVVEQLRSARQVAGLFGVSVVRVRYLARRRGVGRRIDGFLVFTPMDIELLRPASRPGPEAETTRWLRRRNQPFSHLYLD